MNLAPSVQRIAVVGAGCAGLTAALLLQRGYVVTLFEREPHCGGHAMTVDAPDRRGGQLAIDLGFMVFNEDNYPGFVRLLDACGGVECGDSEMSFAYHVRAADESYAVSFGSGRRVGAAAIAGSALAPLLGEVLRFMRTAAAQLAQDALGDLTLGEFLVAHRFSRALAERYVLPMGAALWSAPPRQIEQFPARAYFQFFANHGLLAPTADLRWQHIRGGSRRYVERVVARFVAAGGVVRTGAEVTAVTRRERGAVVTTRGATGERFDAVVLATHANHALRLLADADPAERSALGAFGYQTSEAVLHTDPRVMPRRRDHWAAWNVEASSPAGPGAGGDAVCVTYHLNRLQSLGEAAADWFVTLNRQTPIDAAAVAARVAFAHPVFDAAAIAAQPRVAELSGRRAVYFCGAYLGNGFHEDGVRSGAAVAHALGVAW